MGPNNFEFDVFFDDPQWQRVIAVLAYGEWKRRGNHDYAEKWLERAS